MLRLFERTENRALLRILAIVALLAWSVSVWPACGKEDAGNDVKDASSGEEDAASDGGDAGTIDDCDQDEGVVSGRLCADEGEVCDWGDDCGGLSWECVDGVWVNTGATGCFAEDIPCEEGPEEGEGCEHYPPCDPDGDCRDVLECPSFEWVAYEVCSEEYCPAAAPEQGKACDIEDRFCDIEHRCGRRQYTCSNGRWEFFFGAYCTDPVPCDQAPVPNDACATAGEICEPPVGDLPTLVCDGSTSTWEEQ